MTKHICLPFPQFFPEFERWQNRCNPICERGRFFGILWDNHAFKKRSFRIFCNQTLRKNLSHDFSFEKFKSLIQALLYEISNLDINYEHEKNLNAISESKIKELEEKNNELKSEYEEKIKFYEEKIKLLEDVIFNVDNTTNNKNDVINNNKLIYQALTNSIKDFTNVNMKLKQNLEERISKFKENKKSWLEDIIKAKKDFRSEISYNLTKTMEQPKLIVIGKGDNREIVSKNKKDDKIDELNGKINELNNLINEQNSITEQQSNSIKSLQNEIQAKDKIIEELNQKINNLNNIKK